MKRSLALLTLSTFSFVVLMVGSMSIASAQVIAPSGSGTGTQQPSGSGTGTQDPGASSFDFHIDNPVSGFDNLPDLIVALLEIVMLIISPIIAVMIIYTGYLFVVARGDPGAISKAKDMLLYVVIGAAIILGAKVISLAISGTVSGLL